MRFLGEQFIWQSLEKSCTSSSQVIPEPHALLKPVQTPNCRTTRVALRRAGTGESCQVAPPLRVMVTTLPAVFPSFFPPSFIPCSLGETNARGQSVGERATTLWIKCDYDIDTIWYVVVWCSVRLHMHVQTTLLVQFASCTGCEMMVLGISILFR